MSSVITLSIAVTALRRNAMRTALTALGMIIGVAAVIVMVAIGNGAQLVDREPDPQRRHEHRDGHRRLERVRSGAPGQGATTTLDARAMRRRSRERCRASLHLARREHAAAGRRRNGELEHAGAGHRRRAARDPRRGRCSTGAFFTEQDVARAAKVAVLGVGRARSALRRRRRPDRRDGPHQATSRFASIGVLTRKGQAAMGQDQDDTVDRAVHDRAEEAARHHAPAEHHDLGGRRRAVPDRVGSDPTLLRARHQLPADETTTSRCAGSRRWPPC